MAKNKIYIPYFISNENFAPAKVFPRIYFYNGTKECDIIQVQYYATGSGLVVSDTFTAFPYFDHYSGQTTTTSSLSLLFLNEEPVYGTEYPSQSLYDKYWSNYINLLYNPRTRILRCNAVLPFDVYQNIELNDIIQLRSNYYHLRAINDYNLRTGECRLELLGPLLEGSMDNITFFDTTCLTASVISNVVNDTGSGVITFNITGSNCCNNPNNLVVRMEYGTGSCPATASNTIYVTIPNTNPASVDYSGPLPPGVNCVTMSVANYCFGSDTGSYSFVFTGSLSGSYGNFAISASTQRDNCPTGSCYTASFYTTVVAANTFSSSISQQDAQDQAVAYLTSVSQSNANTFGSCSVNYYSTQISASVQKNDCAVGYTGSFELITLAASHSVNTCSQVEAQTEAQNYFNSISQSQANASGSCSLDGNNFATFSLTVKWFPDNVVTSSYYPLTVSFYTTTSAVVPNETSSEWVTVGYINSSSNEAGEDSVFTVTARKNWDLNNSYSASAPSSSWYNLAKIRGNGGEKIIAQDTNIWTFPFTTSYVPIPHDAYSPVSYLNTLGLGGNYSVFIYPFPALHNNLTQSMQVPEDRLGRLQLINGYSGTTVISPVTASMTGYLTMSYLMTSSTTFPDINDAKFQPVAYLSQSIGSGWYPIVISGSLKQRNIGNVPYSTYVWASGSSLGLPYYYFKITDPSGSDITNIHSGPNYVFNSDMTVGGGYGTSGQVGGSSSGSMLRVRVTGTTSDASGSANQWGAAGFYLGFELP